jgi:hypothetical protein
MTLPVFVSLTTMRSRLARLPDVIHGLHSQSRRPDRLILNISAEPYMLDTGVNFSDLPQIVRDMFAHGQIEIYRVENTGCYRKLLPTLRRFRGTDFLVVTADDDVAYPNQWLEQLCVGYERHDCIVAYRTREMRFHQTGGVLPYARWPHSYELPDTKDSPSMQLMPTGRGGVLYRARHFRDLDLLEELRRIAPGQDDLCYRVCTMLGGVPAAWIPYLDGGAQQKEFGGFHYDESLYSHNSRGEGDTTPNDTALRRLVEFCLARGLSDKHLESLLPQQV